MADDKFIPYSVIPGGSLRMTNSGVEGKYSLEDVDLLGGLNAYGYNLGVSKDFYSDDRSASGNLTLNYDSSSKTPSANVALRKQLTKDGYLDLNGNLTPLGWQVYLGGEIKF